MTGGDPTLDALTTALTSAATSLTGEIGTLVPIALGVFALQWGIRKGIKFFRSAAN